MAEHGLTTPVIGVTFDGSGYGLDGAIWGGEFLIGDYHDFKRFAHLRYVGMPGGEQAVREPWRMAASYLLEANVTCSAFEGRLSAPALKTVRRMIERRFNTPLTSSAGRLFDAVASLIGLRDRVSYEGQAAMQLEWLASDVPESGSYPFEMTTAIESASNEDEIILDTTPMIRAIAHDVTVGIASESIARRFHSTLVDLISAVCLRLRKSTGIKSVVFSGGVFMNALLSLEAADRLSGEGFTVYRHRLVPANDGGLSLGQLAVAASQLTPTE
jgi:hydrogenase maturation protein HypF